MTFCIFTLSSCGSGDASCMQKIQAGFRSPFLPILLLVIVLGLDSLAQAEGPGLIVGGLLDEPAHLATAALILTALAGPEWLLSHLRLTSSAMAASMAIDIDHIPLYAHVPHIAVDGGRPFTHSAVTVMVLALLAFAVRRNQTIFLGFSAGVALHFARDVATGPGLSLWWPLSDKRIEVQYSAYILGLCALVVVAILRSVDQWHEPSPAEVDDEPTQSIDAAKNGR